MNAVEIERAVSELANQPFDRQEFPFQFLVAEGGKDTTLKRLRTGVSNKSDVGGVLQTNNIHIATCAPGQTHAALRASAASAFRKGRFSSDFDSIALQSQLSTSSAVIAAVAVANRIIGADDCPHARYSKRVLKTGGLSAISCWWPLIVTGLLRRAGLKIF